MKNSIKFFLITLLLLALGGCGESAFYSMPDGSQSWATKKDLQDHIREVKTVSDLIVSRNAERAIEAMEQNGIPTGSIKFVNYGDSAIQYHADKQEWMPYGDGLAQVDFVFTGVVVTAQCPTLALEPCSPLGDGDFLKTGSLDNLPNGAKMYFEKPVPASYKNYKRNTTVVNNANLNFDLDALKAMVK